MSSGTKTIRIKLPDGSERDFKAGMTIRELLDSLRNPPDPQPLAALVNNNPVNLDYVLTEHAQVGWIHYKST